MELVLYTKFNKFLAFLRKWKDQFNNQHDKYNPSKFRFHETPSVNHKIQYIASFKSTTNFKTLESQDMNYGGDERIQNTTTLQTHI